MSEPKHGDYFVCRHVDGFVYHMGAAGVPTLVVAGAVVTDWERAIPAIAHGWRLKAGLPDGLLIVKRSTR